MTDNDRKSAHKFCSNRFYMLGETIFTMVAGYLLANLLLTDQTSFMNVRIAAALFALLVLMFFTIIRKSVTVTVTDEWMTVKKLFRTEQKYPRSENTFETAIVYRKVPFMDPIKYRCIKVNGAKGEEEVLLPYFSLTEHNRLGSALMPSALSVTDGSQSVPGIQPVPQPADRQSFRIPRREIMAMQRTKLVIWLIIWPVILTILYIVLIKLDPYLFAFRNLFLLAFFMLDGFVLFLYGAETSNTPESVIVCNTYVKLDSQEYPLRDLSKIKLTPPESARSGTRRLHLFSAGQTQVYHLGRQTGKGVFADYQNLCNAIQRAARDNNIIYELGQ